MKEILKKVAQTKQGGVWTAVAVIAVVYGGDYALDRYVGLPARVDQIEQALEQHRQVLVRFHGDELKQKTAPSGSATEDSTSEDGKASE